MNVMADAFVQVLRPLPDAYILVRRSGRLEAVNPAASRLSDRLESGARLHSMVQQSEDETRRYLEMCARSGALLPGALTLSTANGAVRCRVHGALAEPGEDPLLLLKLQAGDSASRQFLVLNEKISALNAEIRERQRAQEQLQDQAMEMEHLASELEQTVEELQQQTEAATTAQQRAEQTANRFRTLAEASAALSTSLDWEKTLRELARATVRTTADYCIVYLFDEEERLRRVTAAHADPAKQPLVDRLVADYPFDATTGGARAVLLAGHAVLAAEVSDDMLQRAAADEAHLQLLRELAPHSSIVAPLRARERTAGAIAVTRGASRPAFASDDLEVVQELARRAALALENARLYDEAQRANRSKSVFLATMSHELRTPLNAIVGYADLLEAEVSGPLLEGQRQQLSRIRNAADHLRSIIEEILGFARIEANKEQLRVEDVDLCLLVRETTELMRPSLHARGLELNVDTNTTGLMRTDPGKLRQILLNLLGNALKFTPAGAIGVRVGADEAAVRVAVQDTGIGIPPDELRRIFEPFWQVDHGTTRNVGGAGLGLTVSKRLAQLMGGDIEVSSEVGRGSTFTLVMPHGPPSA
jgi:signal transduction histidine kinase/TolA-binding protein